jgi:Icc-related predicted phosphoesterase
MRLQIVSDLHGDAGGLHLPHHATGTELLIVAGDVCAGAEAGFQRLRQHIPLAVPVVMVMGNHEFYGRGHRSELAIAQAAAPAHNIQVLEDQTVVVGGVRVIGSTLWTDYDLFGRDERDDCMRVAAMALNDHRLIRHTDAQSRQFTPADARTLHQQSRAYLASTLANAFPGPTVVVTHHAPHALSVAPHFRNSPLTAAFVSDLSAVIEAYQPNLWIHGHTHTSFDYRVGTTRVICNPAGYGTENPAFDPALVIDLKVSAA